MAQDRNTQRSEKENTGNQQKASGRQNGKPRTTETGAQNSGGQTERADDQLKKSNRRKS